MAFAEDRTQISVSHRSGMGIRGAGRRKARRLRDRGAEGSAQDRKRARPHQAQGASGLECLSVRGRLLGNRSCRAIRAKHVRNV